MTYSILSGENPFYHTPNEELPTIEEFYVIAENIDWDAMPLCEGSGWSVSTEHHDENHSKRIAKTNPNSKEHHDAQKDHKFVQKLAAHIQKHGPNHTHIQKHIGTKSKESWTDRDGKPLHSDVGKAYKTVGLHHTHISHENHAGSEHQKRGSVRTSDRAVHYVVNHKQRKVHILGVSGKTHTSDYAPHAVKAVKGGLHK